MLLLIVSRYYRSVSLLPSSVPNINLVFFAFVDHAFHFNWYANGLYKCYKFTRKERGLRYIVTILTKGTMNKTVYEGSLAHCAVSENYKLHRVDFGVRFEFHCSLKIIKSHQKVCQMLLYLIIQRFFFCFVKIEVLLYYFKNDYPINNFIITNGFLGKFQYNNRKIDKKLKFSNLNSYIHGGRVRDSKIYQWENQPYPWKTSCWHADTSANQPSTIIYCFNFKF